jgi:hypothetical protein
MGNRPSPEDITKIHAEINQCINQRLTIQTSLVALFGVVIGLLVSGLTAISRKKNDSFIRAQPISFLLPSAMLTVTIILLEYNQGILRSMHVLSTYLECTGASIWEKHYQQFSKSRRHVTHDHHSLHVFLIVGLLTIAIPPLYLAFFPPDYDNPQIRITISIFIVATSWFLSCFWSAWKNRYLEKYRTSVMDRWWSILANPSERVENVDLIEDRLIVYMADKRSISVPLAWFPRLLHAASQERDNWEISGAGYGIHWPDIDEYISLEDLLRGVPVPQS